MKKTFYKYTNKILVAMQLNTKKQIKKPIGMTAPMGLLFIAI